MYRRAASPSFRRTNICWKDNRGNVAALEIIIRILLRCTRTKKAGEVIYG